MNLMTSNSPRTPAVPIDALLQDSYLLVVELHRGGKVPEGVDLRALCIAQIEAVRQQLSQAGLSQRSIDHISYAQCALLDETVLSFATDPAHSGWASEPLQAIFFSRHQAGESLYEDMREVLREPAPDRHVLTVFQRVMMLGFKGRYQEADDPDREQLLGALNALVEPLRLSHGLVTQPGIGRYIGSLFGWRSPLTHALAVGLLLLAVGIGLAHQLSGVLSALPPVQV